MGSINGIGVRSQNQRGWSSGIFRRMTSTGSRSVYSRSSFIRLSHVLASIPLRFFFLLSSVVILVLITIRSLLKGALLIS
jgi:hypothetical protein